MAHDDPQRYSHGNVECIDAMRSALSPEEFRGYCKGAAIKYLWREAYKGRDDDLRKALDYIAYAIAANTSGDANK